MTAPFAPFPSTRLRRLRHHSVLRDLVRAHELSMNDLVLPIFVKSGRNVRNQIASMPGHAQLSVDLLADEIREIVGLGLKAILLFGIPEHKDEIGSSSWADDGVIQEAIREIKRVAPQLLVIADVCFCEFTDHGHCGVLKAQGASWELDNDATLPYLARQAVSFAQAGADVIAPSGMIDGMVGAIRAALDAAVLTHVPILSYSIKYASSLYGPFREAAEGAPAFGDRSTYQMDITDGDRALREVALDLMEGADMLMVKPANYYADVIHAVKQAYPSVPLCAYQVSGEYAMIMAAAERGWLDETRVMTESLLALKRAGADFIITYFAKKAAILLRSK